MSINDTSIPFLDITSLKYEQHLLFFQYLSIRSLLVILILNWFLLKKTVSSAVDIINCNHIITAAK